MIKRKIIRKLLYVLLPSLALIMLLIINSNYTNTEVPQAELSQPNISIDYWVRPMDNDYKVRNISKHNYDFDYIQYIIKNNQYIKNNYILGTNNTHTIELNKDINKINNWTKEIIGISNSENTNKYKLPSLDISSRKCNFRMIYQATVDKVDNNTYKESVYIDLLFCGSPVSYKMQDSAYEILTSILGRDCAQRLVYQSNQNAKDLSLLIHTKSQSQEYILCRTVKKNEIHYAITIQTTDANPIHNQQLSFDDIYTPFKYKLSDIFPYGTYKQYNENVSQNASNINIQLYLAEAKLQDQTTYYISNQNGIECEIREIDENINDVTVQVKITPNKSVDANDHLAGVEDIQRQFQDMFVDVEFIGVAQDVVDSIQNNKYSQEIKVKKNDKWIHGQINYYFSEKEPVYAIYHYEYTESLTGY